jgi:hypothetical protein
MLEVRIWDISPFGGAYIKSLGPGCLYDIACDCAKKNEYHKRHEPDSKGFTFSSRYRSNLPLNKDLIDSHAEWG